MSISVVLVGLTLYLKNSAPEQAKVTIVIAMVASMVGIIGNRIERYKRNRKS